jgi:hypothetical protein
VLSRLRLQHFLLAGLLAWGLPGILLGGSQVFYAVVAVSLPVGFSLWGWRKPGPMAPPHAPQAHRLLVTLLVAYFMLDALFGRQKFAQNLFFSSSAVSDFIDNTNAGVSQGRGIIDLLGAAAVFAPFALFDHARTLVRPNRLWLYLLVLCFLVYEIGISRGYLLMAVLSILLGVRISGRRLILAGVGALGLFLAASYVRGDFQNVAFSNPLFDALGWPYLNLSMLLEKNLDGGSWLDFLFEFFKKFLPSFLYPKEIFSFNVEMTKVIYPHFGDYIQSVSIFTYLGELLYYRPTVLTAFSAGAVLGGLARFLERLLQRNALNSTRIFAGLMCIVLLRSRIQDVFSFLIFLALFLFAWHGLTARRPRRLGSLASVLNTPSSQG